MICTLSKALSSDWLLTSFNHVNLAVFFVHLLLDMHPNIMLSKFINNLKTVTSRLMRKEFAEHLTQFYWKPVLWKRAYCLLTVGGTTIDIIRQYIEKQERPD